MKQSTSTFSRLSPDRGLLARSVTTRDSVQDVKVQSSLPGCFISLLTSWYIFENPNLRVCDCMFVGLHCCICLTGALGELP